MDTEISPLLIKCSVDGEGISFLYDKLNYEEPTASLCGCIFNLLATIIGTGLLSLPYAMAGCGIWMGVIVFVVFMLLSTYSFLSLAWVFKSMPRGCAFKDLANATLPQKLNWLVDFNVFVNGFLCACGCLIVTSSLLPQIILSLSPDISPSFIISRFFWCIVFALLSLPFALKKNLDALKFTSFLVFIFVLFSLGVLIYYAVKPPYQLEALTTGVGSPTVYWGFPGDFSQFLQVFALVANAFGCSQNVPSVVCNMINPSYNRIIITMFSATGMSLVVYIAAAIAGYITFGEAVDSDILRSYPAGLAPVTTVRLAISPAMFGTYPIQLHPARNSLSMLLFQKGPLEFSNGKFYSITLIIWAFTLGISLSTDNLGTVLTFVGILATTPLTFIYPNWFMICMRRKDGVKRSLWSHWSLFVLGIILVPLLLGIELYKLSTS